MPHQICQGPGSTLNGDLELLAAAKSDLEAYAEGLRSAAGALSLSFAAAVRHIQAQPGRILLFALGESGHVARKAAATMASTGSPAMFIHAAEALHGDLGMAVPGDVAILISNSGETKEVIATASALVRQGHHTIALTGNEASTLARSCHLSLLASPGPERCPLQLAPTTSTMAQLAILDALALALCRARNFTRGDFALRHPGGSLGHRLLDLPSQAVAA